MVGRINPGAFGFFEAFFLGLSCPIGMRRCGLMLAGPTGLGPFNHAIFLCFVFSVFIFSSPVKKQGNSDTYVPQFLLFPVYVSSYLFLKFSVESRLYYVLFSSTLGIITGILLLHTSTFYSRNSETILGLSCGAFASFKAHDTASHLVFVGLLGSDPGDEEKSVVKCLILIKILSLLISVIMRFSSGGFQFKDGRGARKNVQKSDTGGTCRDVATSNFFEIPPPNDLPSALRTMGLPALVLVNIFISLLLYLGVSLVSVFGPLSQRLIDNDSRIMNLFYLIGGFTGSLFSDEGYKKLHLHVAFLLVYFLHLSIAILFIISGYMYTWDISKILYAAILSYFGLGFVWSFSLGWVIDRFFRQNCKYENDRCCGDYGVHDCFCKQDYSFHSCSQYKSKTPTSVPAPKCGLNRVIWTSSASPKPSNEHCVPLRCRCGDSDQCACGSQETSSCCYFNCCGTNSQCPCNSKCRPCICHKPLNAKCGCFDVNCCPFSTFYSCQCCCCCDCCPGSVCRYAQHYVLETLQARACNDCDLTLLFEASPVSLPCNLCCIPLPLSPVESSTAFKEGDRLYIGDLSADCPLCSITRLSKVSIVDDYSEGCPRVFRDDMFSIRALGSGSCCHSPLSVRVTCEKLYKVPRIQRTSYDKKNYPVSKIIFSLLATADKGEGKCCGKGSLRSSARVLTYYCVMDSERVEKEEKKEKEEEKVRCGCPNNCKCVCGPIGIFTSSESKFQRDVENSRFMVITMFWIILSFVILVAMFSSTLVGMITAGKHLGKIPPYVAYKSRIDASSEFKKFLSDDKGKLCSAVRHTEDLSDKGESTFKKYLDACRSFLTNHDYNQTESWLDSAAGKYSESPSGCANRIDKDNFGLRLCLLRIVYQEYLSRWRDDIEKFFNFWEKTWKAEYSRYNKYWISMLEDSARASRAALSLLSDIEVSAQDVENAKKARVQSWQDISTDLEDFYKLYDHEKTAGDPSYGYFFSALRENLLNRWNLRIQNLEKWYKRYRTVYEWSSFISDAQRVLDLMEVLNILDSLLYS